MAADERTLKMVYAVSNSEHLRRPIGLDTPRFFKEVADWFLYRRTLNELRALNERELADLGLSRFELRAVANEAIYGA